MKAFNKILSCFVLGVLIQGGIYYYLDQVYLAPSTDFALSKSDITDEDVKGHFPDVKEGKKYYSQDKKYMAVVTTNSVDIYESDNNTPISMKLKGRTVSFFEWMPDRDLAIVGLHDSNRNAAILAQFNPEDPEHETDTELEDLPAAARIVDVAYSTATNVVYMKVKIESNAYRIYRTDANYDTRRVYMQASNIGTIAVFYDEDKFFYDNAKTGDVFMFNGTEGGWRVINPPGRYRLIGVDKGQHIYIAKVNDNDEVLSISQGKLGVGFKTVYKYDAPVSLSSATMGSIQPLILQNNPNYDDLDAISDSKDNADKNTSTDKSSSKSNSESKKR